MSNLKVPDVLVQAHLIVLRAIYARCHPLAWLTAPEHKVEVVYLN